MVYRRGWRGPVSEFRPRRRRVADRVSRRMCCPERARREVHAAARNPIPTRLSRDRLKPHRLDKNLGPTPNFRGPAVGWHRKLGKAGGFDPTYKPRADDEA